MPLLNGRGDVLGGAGGAQGSVNGVAYPFQTYGGGAWLDDDTVLLSIPASTPSGSVLARWRPGDPLPTPIAENLGANDWAAGGGRWVAWLAGYGMFGSLGYIPSAGLPNSGTPFTRLCVAPDGTIAYVPDRQAGNALVIVDVDAHMSGPITPIWPLDCQTLKRGTAIWRGGAFGTPTPRPGVGDAITIVAVDLPDGERWLAYWSNSIGFVVQLDGASDGYILGREGTFFNHHARAVNGELWVTYAMTQGEAPETVRVVPINRAMARVPLVPPTIPPIEPPVEPPTEPPVEPPIEPPTEPPVKPPEPPGVLMNAVGYEHINYEGRSQEFPGNAYNLAEQGLANELSSMRVPSGVTITLFEKPQHGGRSLTLTADAPDFRKFPGPGADGTWNDAANSVLIGEPPSAAMRLKRAGKYVEATAARVTLVDRPTDAGLVALTEHNGPEAAAIRFDARFTKANVQLAITVNGDLETRPAGTFGAYEQLFCTTQPDETSILYRLDGARVLGESLVIIKGDA